MVVNIVRVVKMHNFKKMKLFFVFKDRLFLLCCFVLPVDMPVLIIDNDIYTWNPFFF